MLLFHASRIGKRMTSMETLVQRNGRRTRRGVPWEGLVPIRARGAIRRKPCDFPCAEKGRAGSPCPPEPVLPQEGAEDGRTRVFPWLRQNGIRASKELRLPVPDSGGEGTRRPTPRCTNKHTRFLPDRTREKCFGERERFCGRDASIGVKGGVWTWCPSAGGHTRSFGGHKRQSSKSPPTGE